MPRILRNWARCSPRSASDAFGGWDAIHSTVRSRKVPAGVLVGLLLGVVLIGAGAACGDAPREPTAAAPSPIATEPTPTPGPTAARTALPVADGKSSTLTGAGRSTREITLAAGIWTVAVEVSTNETCLRGTCVGQNFVVRIESVGGKGSAVPVNTIAGDWTGRAALRVGAGNRALTPGRQRVSVRAAPTAEWTLTFRAHTDAAPATSEIASSFVLTGTGTEVREITLATGTWTVAINVSENVICIQTNVCVVESFAVELESLDGTGLAAPAKTYAGWWIGRAALRIGAGDRALTPGRQLVSITAAPMAEWILIFEAPADAAPTPSPTLSPDTRAGIVLTGTGTDVREITLPAGIWTGALEVSGNETCVRETCITGFFAVEIESLDGTGLVAPANTIEPAWTGRAVLGVGTDDPALTPGRQRVSITAPTTAEWTLIIESPAEAAPSPGSTLASDVGTGFVLTGTGTDAREITLIAGTWTVALEVTENLICDRGICTSAIFTAGIDSLDGTLLWNLAYVQSDRWTGVVALHVGTGVADLEPGRRRVWVTAEPTAEWILTFAAPAGAGTATPGAAPPPIPTPTPAP